jgi:hypothetical protein
VAVAVQMMLLAVAQVVIAVLCMVNPLVEVEL